MGNHGIAQLQCGRTDQQVCERYGLPFRSESAIDPAGAQSNWNRNRFNGDFVDKFIDESLARNLAFDGVRPVDRVRKLNNRND